MSRAQIFCRWSAALALTMSAGCSHQPLADVACEPVVMVVSGITHDRRRMANYARAIAESGLYPSVAGYYMNDLKPVAVFEGSAPDNQSTLMVRFPNLEAARAFWFSPVYQNEIRPLRLDPSAGDYTVTVYRETALPDYMAEKWIPGRFDPSICREIE
ncbi:MAG: DUF1330 domain-containing protein [Pseudomonadota bacterium]